MLSRVSAALIRSLDTVATTADQVLDRSLSANRGSIEIPLSSKASSKNSESQQQPRSNKKPKSKIEKKESKQGTQQEKQRSHLALVPAQEAPSPEGNSTKKEDSSQEKGVHEHTQQKPLQSHLVSDPSFLTLASDITQAHNSPDQASGVKAYKLAAQRQKKSGRFKKGTILDLESI